MLTKLFTPEQIESVRSMWQQAQRIVIVTHMSPDGDAMGSSLGLRHYLESLHKQVSVIVPNPFPDFLAWMPGADWDLIYESQKDASDALLEAADLVICTDFHEPKRIGSLGDKILSLQCPVMVIDHHLNPHPEWAQLTLSYPASPSASELVYRLIYQMNPSPNATDSPAPIQLNSAICLYTGMMTDTGNFSFNSNYPDTYRIISHLIGLGINKDDIYNRTFNAYSVDRMRLMGYCLYSKMRIFPEHHTALIYLSRKELYRFNFQPGDAEGIVNLPLQISDVYYSCFMREDKVNSTEVDLAGGSKIKIKISLRSQGNRPVNILANELFSGGGHANASGGEYYGPLSQAVDRFINGFPHYFKTE